MSKKTFEQVIAEQGQLIYTNVGDSMYPFIQPRDLLVIERPTRPLRRWDIPLYKRPNGQYVLHRIVDILDDGSYVMRGDNRENLEYGVAGNWIIGVFTRIIRGGETLCVDELTDRFLLTIGRDLLYLVACALNDTAPDPDRCAAMNLPAVYTLARSHMLASAAAFALEKLPDIPRDFEQAKAKAIRRAALRDSECAAVMRSLEDAGVRYIPLSALVLRQQYPHPAMREMDDCAILVDSEQTPQARSVMESLGCSCDGFEQSSRIVYQKTPGLNMEVCRALFDPIDEADYLALFPDNFGRSVCEGSTRYRLSDADCYRLLIARAHRHMNSAGLRILADITVFLRATGLHPDGLFDSADPKLTLDGFERGLRALAQKVFSDENLTASEEKLFLSMIRSGGQGVPDPSAYNALRRNLPDDSRATKRRYLLSRVFLPEKALRTQYPFVYRHRILYPLLVPYRLVKGAVTRPRAILAEYRAVRRYRDED